jgi:N-acyl amino acid synthase of PEP-CTERM/exosortase system
MNVEAGDRTILNFRLIESKKQLEQIYRLRFQVYARECGFIHESTFPDGLEMDKYDPYSLHFVAEDNTGIIGTCRLVLDNPHGFPVEERCGNKLDFEINYLGRDRIAEISRLAISKTYRKRNDVGLFYDVGFYYHDGFRHANKQQMRFVRPIVFGLYREMHKECRKREIAYCMALMEKSLYHLSRMHGFKLDPIGKEIDYHGPVRPYICSVDEAAAVL